VRGEFASITAFRALLTPPGPPVGIWIGDDAAAVALDEPDRWLLLAADTVVAGVHADLGLTGLDDFGWKAVAASVSDIAAMGGDPGHALVTVACPPETDLDRLYTGISEASAAFDLPVVGGDLTDASELVVTVAVTGYCNGAPVPRSGAAPGDVVWVTGRLGAAAAGLRLLRARAIGSGRSVADRGVASGDADAAGDEAVRAHTRPVAQLAAGRAARRAGATAMIDISDGLTADLDHVAKASNVGLRLDSVPVHPAATLEEALGGGEDFVLAFCAPESNDVIGAFDTSSTPIPIGRCTADPAERTLGGEPFTPSGWEHGSARGLRPEEPR
jgi:thiamine-monophosphate kinase